MQCLEKLLETIDKNYESQFRATEYRIFVISPELTGTNFYRFILPGMALNTSDNFSVAFSEIRKHTTNQRFFPPTSEIGSFEIGWARTIIFPFTLHPMKKVFEEIRMINPEVRISFSIDFNFLRIPATHPYYNFFSEKELKNVIENMAHSDKSIVGNKNLITTLARDFSANEINFDINKISCVYLCTDECVLDDALRTEKKSDGFHLMILCNNYQFESFKDCVPSLAKLKEKFGKKLKLSTFSLNPTKPGFSSLMQGIEHQSITPVLLSKYYSQLSILSPDAVLVPNMEDEFSQTSDDYKRYLDCSLLGIPIVTKNLFPFNQVISHEKNGWLYSTDDELEVIMANLISSPEIAVSAGQAARGMVHENFSFNQSNLQRIIESII